MKRQIVLLPLLSLLVVGAFSLRAQRQNETRNLPLSSIGVMQDWSRSIKRVILSSEPIEISNLSVGGSLVEVSSFQLDGQLIKAGKSFTAQDNWAEDVSLDAENLTDKTITHIKVSLTFRTNTDLHVAFAIHYDKEVAPKATVRLTAARQFQNLVGAVAQRGAIPDFSDAVLRVDDVDFSDNTSWRLGTTFRRNPKTGEYEVISEPSPSPATPSVSPSASFGPERHSRPLSFNNHSMQTLQCLSLRVQRACTAGANNGCTPRDFDAAYNIAGTYSAQQTSEQCNPTINCGATT